MRPLWSIALLVGLLFTSPAHAGLVWDRASPASDRGSLLAVCADPQDPNLAWAASSTRVWVSDDGGLAWYLVAQVLGNELGDNKSEEESEEENEEDEESEEEEEETSGDEESYSPIADPDSTSLNLSTGRTRSGSKASNSPVVRLRVIDDQVFLTGNRGLWAIDKNARTLGSAVEVRLGRQLAVRDILKSPWGKILIATSEGLREFDDSGIAGPTPGALGERDVVALSKNAKGVLIATRSDGLWFLEESGSRRVGIAGIQDIRDLYPLGQSKVLIASSNEVIQADLSTSNVDYRWSLRSIERVAAETNGRLWALGSKGAWSWTSPQSGDEDAGQWLLQSEGMGDRRLRDIAIPASRREGADVHLWAVGRGGAWRRVPERVWISARRERADDISAEEGAPPVWELLEHANRVHRVSDGHLTTMRRRGHWASILPSIEAEYQYRIRREEDLLTLTDLDTNFITQVQVYPNGHHVKVMALWDLYPVTWALIDVDNPMSGPTLAEETNRSLQARNQIRNALVGLYTLWAQRRTAWRQSKAPDAQAALKSIISLQHIEADLHVLSHKSFTPMTTLETLQSGGNP